MGRCGCRAVVQLFLTGLTLCTAILAFACSFVFEKFMERLMTNFRGEITTQYLPCIRSTLGDCDNSLVDKCWDFCCPAGYYCARSPIVGLYCKDGLVDCGNFNWCRDFADIPRTCPTEICKNHQMVKRVTSWSYILASIGIFLDLVDFITICTLPDAVIFKSGVNVFSALMKWVAFASMLGAGTSTFLTDLNDARCFNDDGRVLVEGCSFMFESYAVVQIVSATLSLTLAPFSAYYGGKLQGVPYVK